MSLDSFQNELFIPVIAGTLLLATLLAFIGYFIFIHIRLRQKMDWERQQFQQAVLQTEVEIREQTLGDVARELHDNLGQIASLIKINLNLLSKDLQPRDRNKIDDSIDLLKTLISDLRSISSGMNTDILLETGLEQAIRNDANRLNRTGSLAVQVDCTEPISTLAPETEIFLYRMSQEIMTNAVKHASATSLQVSISKKNEEINLRFTDNGKGIDNLGQNQKGQTGNGLRNLYKRCEMIGASININSAPNQGTSIIISLNPNRGKSI